MRECEKCTCVFCIVRCQYETDCTLLIAAPERGILMPGEQIALSLVLDGQSSSLLSMCGTLGVLLWCGLTALPRSNHGYLRLNDQDISYSGNVNRDTAVLNRLVTYRCGFFGQISFTPFDRVPTHPGKSWISLRPWKGQGK